MHEWSESESWLFSTTRSYFVPLMETNAGHRPRTRSGVTKNHLGARRRKNSASDGLRSRIPFPQQTPDMGICEFVLLNYYNRSGWYITWTPRVRRRMGCDRSSVTVVGGNSAVSSPWSAASLVTNLHGRGNELVYTITCNCKHYVTDYQIVINKNN